MAESMEATDVLNPELNYGIMVDCGSSGSRVFVYYWPPHNGNPHTLLDIRQMKDRDHKPVVKKIKPGERLQPATWLDVFTLAGEGCVCVGDGDGGVALTALSLQVCISLTVKVLTAGDRRGQCAGMDRNWFSSHQPLI